MLDVTLCFHEVYHSNKQHIEPYPTEHLTISEPPNNSIDVSALRKICWFTDFERKNRDIFCQAILLGREKTNPLNWFWRLDWRLRFIFCCCCLFFIPESQSVFLFLPTEGNKQDFGDWEKTSWSENLTRQPEIERKVFPSNIPGMFDRTARWERMEDGGSFQTSSSLSLSPLLVGSKRS